jgi:[ribosomal protein S5]-alanine N-acetyltransferase
MVLMQDIQLLDLNQEALALIEADFGSYCAKHNVSAGLNSGRTCDMAAFWKKFMLSVGAVSPWIGYLAIDNSSKIIVGTCAFKGGPDQERSVEIAYFTYPDLEGKGYATAMAHTLIQMARSHPEAPRIIAHTLPHSNASTRVLQKVGMQFVGNAVDPEDGPVWRWEFDQTT